MQNPEGMGWRGVFASQRRSLFQRHGTWTTMLLPGMFGARLVRFGIVGLVGVGVNLAIVRLLFGDLHWAAPLASAIAVEVSIVGNFLGNNRWTFGERTISIARFLRYNLASLGGLAITSLTFTLLLQHTSAPYLLADAVGIGLATGWNFGASILWTWAR
jgi:putative flippase GtrA